MLWEPIPGGGGGPGPRPPDLYGSATGIASAQPGEYWNVADAHVVAVGESVGVNAYKNDNEPAPSAWSISGPATIAGAGASATVVGTAPSASEFDVIVHSVCDETGQTDDELLTVVGVESIEADPEVVCVDGEVSYEITTQPAGYNYMVSYTPADTSMPGIKQVIATCGSSEAKCIVTVVGVELDNTDEEEFFRSESDTMQFTVVPGSYADSLSVSLEGFDNEHWKATFAITDKKIDLVNLIEASEPMVWLDEQMLSISAGIDGVAGEWNWTKSLNLKKRMDGIKDNIMDSLAQTLAEEFATGPGQLAADAVSDQMKDIYKTDSNGIERKFSDIRIGEVSDNVKAEINGAWSDFTGTTIRGNIDSQNLHDQVTDESWTWKWNTELTINVTGGDISVDSGGNPHLNPGDWIRAVNDYGWSQKLFEPQKASLASTLTGDGHVGHALFQAMLFGEVWCSFDGYKDPETDDWTNGGHFGGLTVGIMLKCWF